MKSRKGVGAGIAAGLLALVSWNQPSPAQGVAQGGEWRSYGSDVGGTKYSPLDQIDAANFSDLELAWRWTTIDAFLSTTISSAEWQSASTNVFNSLQDETPELWRASRAPTSLELVVVLTPSPRRGCEFPRLQGRAARVRDRARPPGSPRRRRRRWPRPLQGA